MVRFVPDNITTMGMNLRGMGSQVKPVSGWCHGPSCGTLAGLCSFGGVGLLNNFFVPSLSLASGNGFFAFSIAWKTSTKFTLSRTV